MPDLIYPASSVASNPLAGPSRTAAMPAKKAPIITEKKKKSKLPLLFGILALILLGGGWYLWSTILSKQMSILDIQEGSKKVQIKKVDWQKNVFEHPVFTSLDDSQEEPLVAGTSGGNPNPFTRKLKK